MRKLFAAAVTILIATLSTSQSQTLAQSDRDRALKYLESTRDSLVASARGMSEAQWNFKQNVFRWSTAQVLEHIAASEDFLRGIVENQVLKAPPAPDRDLKQLDDKVLATIPERAIKASAPPPIQPKNRYGSPEAAMKAFLDSRAKTIELLKSRDDLRAHAIDTALGGKLDGYEWILVIAAHSERHTKQFNEVKADPKFPRS
jgi:DinB family protein